MHIKKNRLLPVVCTLCALSLCVMAAALITRASSGFRPPPFEAAAVKGTPEVPEELRYSPVQAKDAFAAYLCGKPLAENGQAVVFFTSPADNAFWLKLRVLDSAGICLGETGLLRPGEYVKDVKLKSVPENGAAVTLKIMAYEPETYYSLGTVSLKTTIQEKGKG